MTETEMRTTHRPVEVRSAGSRSIGGYASVFRRQSENLGGYVERVDPKFFDDSRAAGWPGVVARYEHDSSLLLGAASSGTLRLTVDRTGLNYVVDLPESRSDILELVARGDVGSSSFAFTDTIDDWGYEGTVPLRTLLSGSLIDVAPVSRPAYPDATVGLRSLANYKGVPVEDVVKLGAQDQLRKLFVRTDLSPADARARLAAKAPKPMSGASAKVKLAKRADPMSGHVARARLLGKKHSREVVV